MNIPQVLLNKPAPGAQINFSHPLAKGLVGCWLFNEQSGNQAYDLSPYHNHGTLHGFNDPSSKDRSSLGLQLDGSDDHVDCGNDASLNITDAITIVVTAKLNNLDNTWQTIISKLWDKWTIKQTATNQIRMQIYIVGGQQNSDIVYFTTPQENQWYHLVLVYDKNSGLKGYVNDNLIGTDATHTGNLNSDVTQELDIGCEPAIPVAHLFNGAIDDVRIYNRALSASEILWLYQEPYDMFRI